MKNRRTKTLAGNAAAMREALETLRANIYRDEDGDLHIAPDILAESVITAALAAPPRNCDIHPTYDESFKQWQATQPVGSDYCEWLFAEAGQ